MRGKGMDIMFFADNSVVRQQCTQRHVHAPLFELRLLQEIIVQLRRGYDVQLNKNLSELFSFAAVVNPLDDFGLRKPHFTKNLSQILVWFLFFFLFSASSRSRDVITFFERRI